MSQDCEDMVLDLQCMGLGALANRSRQSAMLASASGQRSSSSSGVDQRPQPFLFMPPALAQQALGESTGRSSYALGQHWGMQGLPWCSLRLQQRHSMPARQCMHPFACSAKADALLLLFVCLQSMGGLHHQHRCFGCQTHAIHGVLPKHAAGWRQRWCCHATSPPFHPAGTVPARCSSAQTRGEYENSQVSGSW